MATRLDKLPAPSTACPNSLLAYITCNKTPHITISWASSNRFLPENISGSVIRYINVTKKKNTAAWQRADLHKPTSHQMPHCSSDKYVACVFPYCLQSAAPSGLLLGQQPDRDGCGYPLQLLRVSFACPAISWEKHEVFSVCRASSVDHEFSCSYPASVYTVLTL